MYEYLEEHAYISKNKKSNYQFELTRERAECIANKYNSLCEEKDTEIERLNNIISKIETLVINHNCDTGDIYYKYNGRYLKSELKDRILELLELKGCDKE